jgi:signal transduction histidine kinase/ligand-binding sensor domain-containing protein
MMGTEMGILFFWEYLPKAVTVSGSKACQSRVPALIPGLPAFVLSFVLVLMLFQAQAQHLNIRSHPINQSLDIPMVFHSIQDTDGFRWFGTETGVVRFDGKNYHRFTTEDGLSDNEVLKIYEDGKKRIWFLTFNGHLSYFHKGRIYNESNSALLRKIGATATYFSMTADKKGGLFFTGGQNRVLYISPDHKISKYNLETTSLPIGLSNVYEDARGQLYLVCNTGFFQFNKGIPQPTRFRYFPKQFKACYSPRPGELYFVAREGLVLMRDTVQQLIIPHTQLPASGEADLLFIDSYERLWIQTTGSGIYVLENLRNPRAGFKLYLKDVNISSVSEGKERNLWFCTTGDGIFMLAASTTKTVAITKEEGLSGNKINAVAKDTQGNIWLALDKGKVARYKDGQVREFDINFSDKFNRVTDLLVDRHDNIWCGTDLGMVQLKKLGNGRYQKIIKLYNVDGRPYSVKSIQQNKAGDITFVQSAGVEKYLDQVGKDGYYTARIPQVKRLRTYTHFYDEADNLWYANIQGLHQIRPDGQKVTLALDSLARSYRITSIKALPQDILVVATSGHGLIFLKKGKFLTHMTTKNGLSSNICRKLFVDRQTVWVATNQGVSRFQFSGDTISQVEIIRTTNGLLSDHILDVMVDQNQVYVATAQGLNILANLRQKVRLPPPPIQLMAVMVGGQNFRNQTNPRLEYFQNRIQFEFIGITFQDVKNIVYQYRLTGSHPAWTATQNTTLEFSSLQPGAYTFEVKAKNQNSNWSPPLLYRFVIAPAFWQAWWFLGLLAFMAAVLIAGGGRLIIARKLRQQRRQLETEYQLQQERERIARDLHDNVGSHLAYIINSLEETPGQENKPNPAHIRGLRDYTKQTITQLRETIWAIRQETISIRELADKIHKLIWQASLLRPGFAFDVSCQGDEQATLTPVQALNLYRIAQEAFQNILKHSHSNYVLVSLTVLPQGQLEMRVEDKGRGFDPLAPRPQAHYGLLNMQQRAQEMGAAFEINGIPGKGTLIYLRVDLK